MAADAQKPALHVLLCSPRGFCAGVVRAIESVERALEIHGAPVYVRHEIVHNRYVVDELRAKGAIFVEELDEIPEDSDRPVIFSAHGVPRSIPAEADRRNLFALDATCPLVTKVHREAEIHHRKHRQILLIGHAGHPEVVGTIGQLPPGAVTLVENVEDVAAFTPKDENNLAYVTQTTLSVEDTATMVDALKARFPNIVGPHKEDICYATTNRQDAVRRVAPLVDAVIVVGAPNSSNSQRLKEVALRAGCPLRDLGAARRRHPLGGIQGRDAHRRHRRRLGAGGAGRGGAGRLRQALHDQRGNRHRHRGTHVLPATPPAAGDPGGGVTRSWLSTPTLPPTT